MGQIRRVLRRFFWANPRRNFLQKETKETKVLTSQRNPSSFSSLPSACFIRELNFGCGGAALGNPRLNL